MLTRCYCSIRSGGIRRCLGFGIGGDGWIDSSVEAVAMHWQMQCTCNCQRQSIEKFWRGPAAESTRHGPPPSTSMEAHATAGSSRQPLEQLQPHPRCPIDYVAVTATWGSSGSALGQDEAGALQQRPSPNHHPKHSATITDPAPPIIDRISPRNDLPIQH